MATPLTEPGEFTKGVEGPACDREGNLYVVNFGEEGTIGLVKPDGTASLFVKLPEGSTGNGIRFDLGKRTWLRGRPLRLGPLHTHTTSLASGLLFIGIGLLFLGTDGTANLTGVMGVDEQFDAQVALGRWAAALSGPGALLIVVLALFVVVAVRVLRVRR